MTKQYVTITFDIGTYEEGDGPVEALLVTRSDQPGVCYPFPADYETANALAKRINHFGLSVLDGCGSTNVYHEYEVTTPASFEVLVTDQPPGGLH